MKVFKSKQMEQDVSRARELRDIINAAKKELDPLIDKFQAELADENSAKVGDYLLIATKRQRSDLDKKALAQRLGDAIKEFEKITVYTVIDIKKS